MTFCVVSDLNENELQEFALPILSSDSPVL